MLILILISSISLACTILLFGLRFCGVRELKTEEIYKGAVYGKPFWEEFITFLQPVARKVTLKAFLVLNNCLKKLKNIKFKKYTKKFSNYKRDMRIFFNFHNGNSN